MTVAAIPAAIPVIIPSTKNGIRINVLVAPTYFIMLISFLLANTLALVVFEIITIDTIASAIMIADATRVIIFFISVRILTKSYGALIEYI